MKVFLILSVCFQLVYLKSTDRWSKYLPSSYCHERDTLVLRDVTYLSPDYPDAEPDTYPCIKHEKEFVAPHGYVIHIYCSVFNVDDRHDCYETSFEVSDGTATVKSCGDQFKPFTSVNNHLTIKTQYQSNIFWKKRDTEFKFNCTLQAMLDPNGCDCGVTYTDNSVPFRERIPRILRGTLAENGELPWQGTLLLDGTPTAGAVLIGDRWALTSASAVIDDSADYTFACGSPRLDGIGFAGEIVNIAQVTSHPDFDEALDFPPDDIAILEFETPITEFSDSCRPVCLPYRLTNTNFAGVSVTSAGWGEDTVEGLEEDLSKSVNMIVSNDDCFTLANPDFSINDNVICTLADVEGPCVGDEGGGVVWEDPLSNHYYLLGLIANVNCIPGSGSVTVNVRITSYLDWIDQVTGEAQCNPRLGISPFM